ncbi:hypothetical protein Dda_7632 [Drechslerella dactyloides]|uniref:Uncharacterized protein n=1 Tax=Drechslerella dactyloides TaxID=74499 RepID=A0AAD6NIH7_DREDA|nr:hypothetical protein Dda_7632 [Drechslerella dactyloides]
MCFFNRFRFQCGHQQYVIFQLCPSARHARGRSYYTACRPSKRANPNFRKWEMLGLCENCLKRQHGVHYLHNARTGLWNHSAGVPNVDISNNLTDYDYVHDTSMQPYTYAYYPGGSYDGSRYPWDHEYTYPRRGSTLDVSTVNPDECDAPGCMTIATPKDVARNFHRTSYGRPHMGSSRRVFDPYSTVDGRWHGQWDREFNDSVGGRMSPGLETVQLLEDADRYGRDAYDGVPVYTDRGGDPYMRMRYAGGRPRPDVHLVD